MNPHLQRALLLLGQSRYDLAKTELHKVLGEDPDNGFAHSILAICLAEAGDLEDAKQEAQLGIHLAADEPFSFYAYSIVFAERNEFAAAKAAAESAIGMDPYDHRYFAQLAQVELELRNWKAALAAAEDGLELDAENPQCTNLRAIALVRLGKNIEAQDALGSALRRAPEDAYSHANMGWSRLEESKPKMAMEHFQEALRLEPEMEWARVGIVEAMKARHLIYRLMLNWFLWMNKLQQKAQFSVIIGAYIGYRVLAGIARNQPALAPYIWPVLVLYLVFAVMTWLASPLFNLVLRTSKFGRLALSDEQIRTSNWVGICVLGALSMVGMFFWSGSFVYLGAALVSAFTIPPVSRIYACAEGWPRAAIVWISIAIGALAALIWITFVVGKAIGGETGETLLGIGFQFLLPHIYISVAMQFGVSVLMSARPQPNRQLTRYAWIGGGVLVAVLALIVLGYSGLTLLRGARPQLVLFNQPIRTKAIPRDDLVWNDTDTLEQNTDFALQNGFTLLGDFEMEGVADMKTRLLYNSSNDTWCEMGEAPNLPLMALLTSAYDGNRTYTLSNGPDIPFEDRPEQMGETMDVPLEELYKAFYEKRPKEEPTPLTEANVVDLVTRTYHADVDFLLGRGGPSAAELGALLDPENTLTDETLENCVLLWKQQASGALNDYVIEQLKQNPEHQAIDGTKLLCVHDLLSVYAIQAVVEDYNIKHEDLSRIEVLRQISDHAEGKREWFAEFAAGLPRLKFVKAFDSPIAVDVYEIQ